MKCLISEVMAYRRCVAALQDTVSGCFDLGLADYPSYP
jgi:hypothetical protein